MTSFIYDYKWIVACLPWLENESCVFATTMKLGYDKLGYDESYYNERSLVIIWH